MTSLITVTSAHVRMLVEFGARRGLDVPAFLSWLELDPATLADPEARIAHEKLAAAFDEIPRRVHAPDLGLELSQLAGAKPPNADMGVLVYVARSSATVGESFANVIRYLRVVHDGGSIRLDADGAEARIFLRPVRPIDLPRHAREFMLASMVEQGRRVSGDEGWAPRIVRFEHEEPAETTLHRRIFRAPLEFGSGVSEVVFDRAFLDRPVVSADPQLNAVIARHAESLIARLPRLDAPSDAVRQRVASIMREGQPEIRHVARSLAMSIRSLQRLLRAENLTFRGVVDDVRRELALRHVTEQRFTSPEIAFLLGFSDSTAFHRAFRRWTGVAPGEFRRAGAPGQCSGASRQRS